MTVQFSGGEPTISPCFLEAVAYARAMRSCPIPENELSRPEEICNGSPLRVSRMLLIVHPASSSRTGSATASKKPLQFDYSLCYLHSDKGYR